VTPVTELELVWEKVPVPVWVTPDRVLDGEKVPEMVFVSEVVCDITKTTLRRMNAIMKKFFIFF